MTKQQENRWRFGFEERAECVTSVVLAIDWSAPVCLLSPYFGVLIGIGYLYESDRFKPGDYAYETFSIAVAVAVPTLAGMLFPRKSMRSLAVKGEPSPVGFLVGVVAYTYIHAQGSPPVTGNIG